MAKFPSTHRNNERSIAAFAFLLVAITILSQVPVQEAQAEEVEDVYIPAFKVGDVVRTNFACRSKGAILDVLSFLEVEAAFRSVVAEKLEQGECVFSPIPRRGVLTKFLGKSAGWDGGYGEAWEISADLFLLLDSRVGRQRGTVS